MTTKELEILLDELTALPSETEWVEFKDSNYFHQTIGEYISALSNSACLENKDHGYLIFGIEDGTHKIVGTTFQPKKEKIGNQELENWLATLLNPRIDFRIFEIIWQEKRTVLFQIDATKDTPVSFKGEAYIRIGSYKKKLKEHPERERKIWHNARRIIFESDFAIRNVSGDIVLNKINYPAVFQLLNEPLPPNKDAILKKLEEEKLIIHRLGKYHITNLGAILFANNLRDFETLERKAVRVIIYDGKNKLKTVKEQTGTRGYAVGFKGLIDYINDKLPSNEEIDRVIRKEVKVYPELAIRELVANAIIHQDFLITGTSPMVEIFSNRIEITNPGKPLIDTKRFIDHSPESRNEKLAGLMRRMGFCEERGSGIDKVIVQIELFQLPAPEFIEGDNFTRVIIHSPKTLRQMSKPDRIRACYQHCCLKYVSGENMSNQSLRQRLGIKDTNYPMVSRIIKDSIDLGLIKEYDNARMYIPFWAG